MENKSRLSVSMGSWKVHRWLRVLVSTAVTSAACSIVLFFGVENPIIILFTVMVFFTFTCGFSGGIPSGIIIFLYGIVYFSGGFDNLFIYSHINFEKLVVTGISIPIMVMMVGLLRVNIDKMTEELVKANEELKRMSRIDPLTDIGNRRALEETLTHEIAAARRSCKPLSAILLDIDFFKQYNDTYGHMAGDRALKKIAEALCNNLKRETDFVARYGGEEFFVLLPATDSRGAYKVAENLRMAIAELKIDHRTSSVSGVVTVSAGIVTTECTESEYDAFKILEKVDTALYEAKRTGRNKSVSYNVGLKL